MEESDLEDALYVIAGNFDYNKVYRVMELLNWNWGISDKLEVPSKMDMLNTVKFLARSNKKMLDADSKLESIISCTGGFSVTSHQDNTICVEFVLESSTYDGIDHSIC